MSDQTFNPARYDEVFERVRGEGFEILEVHSLSGEQNGYAVKRGDIVLYQMNTVVAVYPGGYCEALVRAMGLDVAEETINRHVIDIMCLLTEAVLGGAA